MSEQEPNEYERPSIVPYSTPRESTSRVFVQILKGVAMFALWLFVGLGGTIWLAGATDSGASPWLSITYAIATLVALGFWVRHEKRNGSPAIVPIILTIFGIAILTFGACTALLLNAKI